ncbi:MAG: hypothetical protein ABI347_05105 [Nitrososphaera sp.]|jgi:hypothetical protein
MSSTLKDALDEVLRSEIGEEARVSLWQYLRRYYGIVAEDLDTLEKVQQALRPAVGSVAKPLANMAFARYMSLRKERVQEKELDQSGISN